MVCTAGTSMLTSRQIDIVEDNLITASFVYPSNCPLLPFPAWLHVHLYQRHEISPIVYDGVCTRQASTGHFDWVSCQCGKVVISACRSKYDMGSVTKSHASAFSRCSMSARLHPRPYCTVMFCSADELLLITGLAAFALRGTS